MEGLPSSIEEWQLPGIDAAQIANVAAGLHLEKGVNTTEVNVVDATSGPAWQWCNLSPVVASDHHHVSSDCLLRSSAIPPERMITMANSNELIQYLAN